MLHLHEHFLSHCLTGGIRAFPRKHPGKQTKVHLFFQRNCFIRNLYWDSQMAKKLPVLKPCRIRNLDFFLSFPYYNFETTLT